MKKKTEKGIMREGEDGEERKRLLLRKGSPVSVLTLSDLVNKLSKTGYEFSVDKANPLKFPKKYVTTVTVRCLHHHPLTNCAAPETAKMMNRIVLAKKG